MASQLIINVGQQTIKRVPLDQQNCLVGRAKHCDLVLYDRMVSHEHARIFPNQLDFFVEDLGSTNGTYVNQFRIELHPLQDGDIIRLGRHEIIYQTEELGLQRQISKLAIDPRQNKDNLKAYLTIMDGRRAGMVIKLDHLPLMLGESLGESIQLNFQQNQWQLEYHNANGRIRHEILAPDDALLFQGITFKLQQRL